MRQFTDRDGRWRVWAVNQAAAESVTADVSISPDGWLCFESVENDRRYRLAMRNVPAGWDEGSDIILRQLLTKAKKAVDSGVTSKSIAKQRRDLENGAR